MLKRVIIITVMITSITIVASFYAPKSDTSSGSGEKISVVTSFYVLGNFIENIGGDIVSVRVITPPGIEPHDYEPTPNDLVAVGHATLFIYNGAGFDPWANQLINSSNAHALNMSEQLNLVLNHPGETSDPQNFSNPHYWLDPVLAIEEVRIIRDALITLVPSQQTLFKKNAEAYINRIALLHHDFEEGLGTCANHDIIVSHNAFEYLGIRYTINTIPIAGISPEDEPSTKKIGELTQLAKEKDIRFIFFETSASPKLAETIAREVGIKTLVLNPIETLTEEELKVGEDYISVMKTNLNNLRKALVCM
ncbi:MAG: zinc ABC transporter substrate-binding protein [bacterium]|nr:zinc ABC transporter substrate-binding protein [bacterium]